MRVHHVLASSLVLFDAERAILTQEVYSTRGRVLSMDIALEYLRYTKLVIPLRASAYRSI